VKDGGVSVAKKRRESSGFLIAQTTGVSLIPCFVGGDEEMRGRVSPFLCFFFPPGLLHSL